MVRHFLKNCYFSAIKNVIKLIDHTCAAANGNHISRTIHLACEALETKTEYVSYQIMPKDTSVIPVLEGVDQSSSFAIVLQGPFCSKDDMTVNSIRFYKKIYPLAKIIVSTWNDEAKEDIDKIAEMGVTIVQSEKPSNSGILNVNYQLTNSLAGVRKAKELGCELAVKTRTDQRVCKPFIFDAMISAMKLFPGGQGQKGRLVTLGVCGGGMFIPYYTCDFLYLGYTDDLIKFFSAPLDQRDYAKMSPEQVCRKTRFGNSAMMYPPEIYIMKHYCKDVLGLSGADTVEEYWNVTKNYLISYGMKDVGLMWDKYDRMYNLNYYSSAYYGKSDSPKRLQTMCFDFTNWFNLYMGNIKYDRHYEQLGEELL